tara:strand:+ start:53 stop:1372 length:1320 start_codon:yes stop_codon:yes gene_type:complete
MALGANKAALLGAAGSSSTASTFTIDQSIRFDGSTSYLSKAFSGAGSLRTATMSCWVKLCSFSSGKGIFTFISDKPLEIDSNDNLKVVLFGSTRLITDREFRDPSAWYHFVLRVDSTAAPETSRIILYVNGERETEFSTESYPSQNADGSFWSSNYFQIGRTYGTSNYMNGYLAEINYLDGISVGPESFGETNSNGLWIPKQYSGSYGTNGFRITGADANDLGEDAAGSNDFSENGLDATDKKTDTPTNNHATWNPLTGSSQAYTNGNLNAASSSSAWKGGLTTAQVPLNSGTWYYEIYVDSAGASSGQFSVGWSESNRSVSDDNSGGDTEGWVTYAINGLYYSKGGSGSYGATYTTGNVIGCKINTNSTSNNVEFYKDGASQGTLSQAFNTGGTGFISPYILLYGTRNGTARFSQAEWTQTPSGITEANAINTTNLGS